MTEEIRRTSERKNLHPPYQQMLRWTGQSGDYDGTMHDVSMQGCFLNTRGTAEIGESISFTTVLPTGDPVTLIGQVVHKHHPKLYGFGVKFADLSDKERMYLKLLIADAEVESKK